MDQNEQDLEGSVASGASSAGETKIAEVSAATIGRMMGLVTASEFRLLEGKVDLLTTKMTTLTMKLDKIMSILGAAPTGADLERIDVQIGSLKQVITTVLGSSEGRSNGSGKEA